MEHKDLWLVIGLTVILAVAVSISTVSLTGDAIFGKVSKTTISKTPIKTNVGNLQIPSKCKFVKHDNLNILYGSDYCYNAGYNTCLYSFAGIYMIVKESKDGSCSGKTLWTLPEGRGPNAMMYPTNCNERVGTPELVAYPAYKQFPNGIPGVLDTSSGSYCFKGTLDNGNDGHDIWVSSDKTLEESLCCNL